MKAIVIAWLAALAALALVHHNVAGLHKKVDTRVAAMKKQVASAATFRERLDRMRPVEKQFAETIPALSQARDVFAIYELLEIPADILDGTPERVGVSSVNEVKHNDKSIGVTSVCLNSGAGTFVLKTENLAAALPAVQKLFEKPWITAKDILIEATPGRKTLYINVTGLCAYLRS